MGDYVDDYKYLKKSHDFDREMNCDTIRHLSKKDTNILRQSNIRTRWAMIKSLTSKQS